VFILSLVEGITEFLPISSTGHLILATKILGLLPSDFLKSFEIAIQLGAILSVVLLYWQSLVIDRKLVGKIFTAFFPTAVLGLIFYKCVKNYLLNNEKIVLIALFIGGVSLILFELFYRGKKQTDQQVGDISYKQAFIIGVCQSLAIIPGVSRSLATILGGLALGINRKTIVQFSFLLAIPTMVSAVAYDLAKSAGNFTTNQFYYLGLGFIISFITAFISIRFLIAFIEKHNFIVFGVYRILLVLFLSICWR
jgi:undecaprenyl-diphosphatase